MKRTLIAALLPCIALAACNDQEVQERARQEANNPRVKIRSSEQEQLHKLDAFNLAIGLKRAIYDAGYSCKTITEAGFVGTWKNLDQWMARCRYDNGSTRDWAIFAGPDGSAQVRDCKDVDATGLPKCEIKKRPQGSFEFKGNEGGGAPKK